MAETTAPVRHAGVSRDLLQPWALDNPGKLVEVRLSDHGAPWSPMEGSEQSSYSEAAMAQMGPSEDAVHFFLHN